MSVSSLTVSALAALALLVVTAKAVVGSVPRRRVEEFARLHSLPVTVANGNQIIVYRATTRRWRATGFATGVVTQVLLAGPFFLNFMWAFAGWFAGAAVAELRVAHLDPGPRASASLTPRRAADYLPRAGRLAVPITMLLCGAAAVFALTTSTDARSLTLWTALGLATGTVALAAQHHVLRRPQPLTTPDRLAADDAIRSRSLHVIAASGMVLVGFCVVAQLNTTSALLTNTVASSATTLCGLAITVLGRLLAYWPSMPVADAADAADTADTTDAA